LQQKIEGEKGKTMREKLIELIEQKYYCSIEELADHLIANGVTVQKWIPVTERLPESQNPVLVVAVSKGMGLPYIFKAAHINHHEITEDEYGWTDGEYDSEYDEENDCFWIPECWYECNAVEGNTNWVMDEDYTITHWMPLPEPPKGE
jgi:hypothetical protein